MKIAENSIFHIYNRGNQQQPIFFCSENYDYFLRKIKYHILPVCDILEYCLMPNHFHFIIKMDERSVEIVAKTTRDIAIHAFSKNWRILLSSYTRGLQKQQGFTGSLFQQKTKAKLITRIVNDKVESERYLQNCKAYLINNPVAAGLVDHPREWQYSSIHDTHDLIHSPYGSYSSYDLES